MKIGRAISDACAPFPPLCPGSIAIVLPRTAPSPVESAAGIRVVAAAGDRAPGVVADTCGVMAGGAVVVVAAVVVVVVLEVVVGRRRVAEVDDRLATVLDDVVAVAVAGAEPWSSPAATTPPPASMAPANAIAAKRRCRTMAVTLRHSARAEPTGTDTPRGAAGDR